MTKTIASKTVLAFDLGLKRTGVAVGNTITKCAQPLHIIRTEKRKERLQTAADLVQQWGAQTVVVGLPMHPDGTAHEMTGAATNFSTELAALLLKMQCNAAIVLVDERYSSAIAGVNDDADAAGVILQQYFDEDMMNNSTLNKKCDE